MMTGRCPKCGAAIPPDQDELLTIDEIQQRYKIGRTKALELRRELARSDPKAVLRSGRVVRVRASALYRLWSR
jgi:hypothetical protein